MSSRDNYNNIDPLDERSNNNFVFIWLDILGFADLLNDESKYEKLSELLYKFQLLFNNEDDYITNIISDGIILRIKTKEFNEFQRILKDIGEKQFQFVCDNEEFIRGGIAVGSILNNSESEECTQNTQFISSGLARAVKIEETQIDWPIIGTNQETMSEIRKLFRIPNQKENFGLKNGYNAKGKKVYFIDYLSENNPYYELLNKKIQKYTDKIQSKYIWLLRYYHHEYKDQVLDASLEDIVL